MIRFGCLKVTFVNTTELKSGSRTEVSDKESFPGVADTFLRRYFLLVYLNKFHFL